MNEFLTRSWWMLALRGAAALVFGVLALIWPGITLLWLVALFCAYMLIAGVASVSAAVKNRRSGRGWWLVLLLGIVSIAAAFVAILNPGLTALLLVVLMGANALVTGIVDIVMAVRLRKVIRREWLLAAAGIVSVIFGALVLVYPGVGALALVWLISVYAITTGVLLLVAGFRARSWSGTSPAGGGRYAPTA